MQKQKLLILFDGKNELLSNLTAGIKDFYAEAFDVVYFDIFEDKNFSKLVGQINSPLENEKGGFYKSKKKRGGPKSMRFYTNLCHGGKIKKLVNKISEINPDIIVTSNFFLSFASLKFKRKIKHNCRIISVNPDLVNHKWWDNKDNFFIVNNETAFYDAIGKKRFSPALVYKSKPFMNNEFCNLIKQKQTFRDEFEIKNTQLCFLFDAINKKTLKILSNISQISGDFCVFIFYEKTSKQLILQKLIKHKNKNLNIKFIQNNDANKLKYQCAADVFVTSDNYPQMRNSLLCNVPIILYSFCKKFNPLRRFFIDETAAGVYITKPKKILSELQNFVSNQSKLDELKTNASNVCELSSNTQSIANTIFEISQIPLIDIEKKPYDNLLYELALQERFDTFTTPININSAKNTLNYEKLKKKNVFLRFYGLIIRGLLKALGPVLNFFGFRIKIKGRKNLKGIKSAITISNHVHYLDCLWNYQALTKHKRVYFTGAPFNFKKGFLGSFLRAGGFIPIATSFSQKKEFDKYVSELLEKGSFVHFYPEQALWLKFKQSRPLKKGAFLYASKNNVPIVPVVICFKKAFTFTGFSVTVQICEPIFPDENLSQTENCKLLNELAQKTYDNTIIDFYHYDKNTYALNKINTPKFDKK